MDLEIHLTKSNGNFNLEAQCAITEQKTGLFGPSGSGKSTLMHLLAGLQRPDRGYIRLNGDLLYSSEQNINIPANHRRIGVVFQHAYLFEHLSVKKNLLYGWKRTPPDERRIAMEKLLNTLAIDELLSRKVNNLSGGEKQRVALARTILASPKLLLMDEPMTGLDDALKFQIIPYLNKILDEFEIPLLFISHNLLEMRLLVERAVVIEKGRITGQLSTEELARSSWTDSKVGYLNLLKLGTSQPQGDLHCYDWQGTPLVLTEPGSSGENLFELDAREILLFRRHPQATSARNLLTCTVTNMYTKGNRVRVELDCSGKTLIVQIVPESVAELKLTVGSQAVAAIKASAFRKLL